MNATTPTIDLTADIIDVRDIIARVEHLEQLREPGPVELAVLEGILADLQGNGGDERWRGDWYPLTLIADRHFRDYAQELAEDCGDVDFSKLSWPLTCIDWDQAARELRMDYSSVTVDGDDYWYYR